MSKIQYNRPWKTFLYLISLGLALCVAHSAFAADYSTAPGGFMEADGAAAAPRAALAASHVSLPSTRGSFTFPAPYNTHGVRVTVPSDCGGQDCLDMTYNYWKNMSNSTGSDTMYVFVGLSKARGGQGPTLFQYTKSTGVLTEVGPLFAANDPLGSKSTEGWYFSYSMPTTMYLQEGSKLERYDVLSHAKSTVFDTTSQYPGTVIHQTNSSNDDDVHSATLENASTFAVEGCIAYKASSNHFYFFPAQGKFDECQIDKSGRYLEIKEKLPQDTCASCDEDDVIEDLQTGTQQVLLDKDGAGGHSDLGYGYMAASDNWNTEPNAWRVWQLGQSSLTGNLVYYGGTWGIFSPSHMSWANASATAPLSQQYMCGAAATASTSQRDNDVQCFTLDPTTPVANLQALIVAPVMTSTSGTGGSGPCPSCLSYGQDPKGNLDPTGQYFFWVSNMGGSRMDAFMVQVPTQVMGITGNGSGNVTITSPQDGAVVTGNLNVTASVPSGAPVAQVTFTVDGGSATTSPTAPYQATWPEGDLADGTHTLTATATDTNGVTTTSAPVTITVGGKAKAAGGGGGGGAMSLFGLIAFGFFGLWRKLVRQLDHMDAQASA